MRSATYEGECLRSRSLVGSFKLYPPLFLLFLERERERDAQRCLGRRKAPNPGRSERPKDSTTFAPAVRNYCGWNSQSLKQAGLRGGVGGMLQRSLDRAALPSHRRTELQRKRVACRAATKKDRVLMTEGRGPAWTSEEDSDSTSYSRQKVKWFFAWTSPPCRLAASERPAGARRSLSRRRSDKKGP
eukprot:3587067-Amphidinium_carterae.2